ncbi:MAG: LysM peptidoglycan-binding domain-containing protein [Anaerolineae bacterium]|nr:LysM peptidoglycan-binding domain-containing protein [Anaerolineae bacterium]
MPSPCREGVCTNEQPPGPVYLVQPGDTLTIIALQFGVTVDELLTVNGLSSTDLIFAGDSIIIPGLEGITGVLETQTVPYGETLRSLSRRYQIPTENWLNSIDWSARMNFMQAQH